ncbi:hypothetical protein MUK71_00090 [Arthrobacter zhangbolii]|uniref:Uncharacterized protein n=1 Tax=Arthrobacter zhangbolii TaxID=2886936 RepID=A0A9X1M6Y6_9MICC|nr:MULTISPECIES: hypothetical protein [Arthrobacter]MCC3272012.1 hypothetical protein [Arthrobacter zhangbolii]MCC3294506.1 hypothetical protein [Arthrobacter zhangbolii]MDN3903071.1 hypothetical protein [Arthrobacter sp. YD2]UON92108.1 hypothetical protein MUK71_00090 [Arthrobacter zhangbolii]
MYGWIFRHLPGPLWVRILLSAVLIAAAVLALMEYVFPWLAENSFFPSSEDSTIGGS